MTPKILAQKIYDDFGFGNPWEVDPPLIANNFNLIIELTEFTGADGLIIAIENGGIIKINKNIKDPGWYRFTIAHEIGHFLYRKLNGMLKKNPVIIYSKDPDNIKEEKFVNDFAAELLMPEKIYLKFVNCIQPNMGLFKEISERFNVSIPAAAVRYTTLGKEPISVILSKNGIVQWKMESEKFPLKFIRYYSEVPADSCANFVIIHNKKYGSKKIKASVWFKNDFKLRKYENLIFNEESLLLDDGITVLSILRIEKFVE